NRLRMRRVEDVEELGVEGAAQHLGREARAAHAQEDDVVVPVQRLLREADELRGLRPHPPRLVEPAEPPLLARRGPERRVARPDPANDLAVARAHAPTSSCFFDCTPSSSSAKESMNFWTPSSSRTRTTSS